MFTLKKLKPSEQGFTLVEVLVAILLTTLFVGVAMQTMVIAAIFKAKAQEYAEATTWIQTDLEATVKYQATILQFPQTTLNANAAAAASSIIVNGNLFATNDTFKIGLDTTNYTVTNVTGSGTTRTLTISPNLGSAQLVNAGVIATKMCNPAARNVGLADELRDKILISESGTANTNNSNNVDVTKTFRTGKTFTGRRTTTLAADFPHSVLQVKYEVSPGTTFNSSNIIAIFDTEVIPNVAFQCP